MDENCVKMECTDVVVKHSLPSIITVSPDLRNAGIDFPPNFTLPPKIVLTFPPVITCVGSYATGSPDAGSSRYRRSSKYSNFGPTVKVAIDRNCESGAESEEEKVIGNFCMTVY